MLAANYRTLQHLHNLQAGRRRDRPCTPSLPVARSGLDLGLDPVPVSTALGADGGGGKRFHVVVHPQSIIHSLVQLNDGSTLAQLGPSDMRVPIASVLAWPARMDTPCAPLDPCEP